MPESDRIASALGIPKGFELRLRSKVRIFRSQKTRADWGVRPLYFCVGRREKIRTSDPYHPKVVRYQAAPRAVNC